MEVFDTEMYDVAGIQTEEELQEIEEGSAAMSFSCNTITSKKKRTSKACTPIVDDEVRRSARLRRDDTVVMVQLDNEPRRRKGEAKKTVRFSIVEDLKKSIISGQIGQPMEVDEMEQIEAEPIEVEPIKVEPIASNLLVTLGTEFCGVPPRELTVEALHDKDND
jgi:hypothetical protein